MTSTASTGTIYKRSRSGVTVHKAFCPRAGNAVRWDWATGMPEHELRVRLLAYPHLKECAVCFDTPLAALVMVAVTRPEPGRRPVTNGKGGHGAV